MTNAYAGMPEPQQQQLVVGQTRLQTSKDITHQIVDYIGENYGYGTVLIILVIGVAVILRKKIFSTLKGDSNGK